LKNFKEMKNLNYLGAFILFLMMTSCGSTEIKTIRSANVEMVEEYPMEGSNTLTGIWQVDLEGIDIDKVKSAKVTSIRVKMQEPATSDLLEEIIMQLAAKGTDMQRVGMLNPVPVNQQEIDFSIASEQENLLDLLRQKEITLVADVNLQQDLPGELSIVAEIEFELEVQQ
jgi:hypothetical protein